jgi:hypothetical protein
MKFKILALVLVLLPTHFLLSQVINYSAFNLKGLRAVSLKLEDDKSILSETVSQKMLNEIKLKFRSAGIKVNDDKKNPTFIIHIDIIKSNFADHRVVNHLMLLENVSTTVERTQKTGAITYMDYSFKIVSSDRTETEIYNNIMDIMIVKFLDKYLEVNN